MRKFSADTEYIHMLHNINTIYKQKNCMIHVQICVWAYIIVWVAFEFDLHGAAQVREKLFCASPLASARVV